MASSFPAHSQQPPQAEVRPRHRPQTHLPAPAHNQPAHKPHHTPTQRPAVKRGRPGQGGDEDMENNSWQANAPPVVAGAKPRLPSCLVGTTPEIVATGA